MKNAGKFITVTILCCSFFESQVGINTQSPTAMLDINGDLRIRSSPVLPLSEPVNKVMIFDNNNIVNNVDLSRIIPSNDCIVKGIGGTGFTILSLSLLNGWQKASFPSIEIDEGSDFNTLTQEFTAPADGIYDIYFFTEVSSAIVGATLGAGIFKVDAISGTITLLCEESFLNISVVGINVSSPTRATETIVRLNKNDKIVFGTRVPLINIGLLANSKATFSIWRMK